MKIKPIINVVIFFILMLMALIIANNFINSKVDVCEQTSKKYENISLNGIVSNKYIDNTNHGIETLEITTGIKKQYYSNYRDNSGFYMFVKNGDSIVKNSGSMEIKVFRDKDMKTFILDFHCDDLK